MLILACVACKHCALKTCRQLHTAVLSAQRTASSSSEAARYWSPMYWFCLRLLSSMFTPRTCWLPHAVILISSPSLLLIASSSNTNINIRVACESHAHPDLACCKHIAYSYCMRAHPTKHPPPTSCFHSPQPVQLHLPQHRLMLPLVPLQGLRAAPESCPRWFRNCNCSALRDLTPVLAATGGLNG